MINNFLWQLSQFQGNKMKYTGKEKPGKGGKGGKKGC
jgi:hypothetical protein